MDQLFPINHQEASRFINLIKSPNTKRDFFDEANPTTSQLEWESFQYVMKVFESFGIDFKQTSKLSVAKATVNKSLEEVLKDEFINFDSIIKLPPRLTCEKGKIKTLQLF